MVDAILRSAWTRLAALALVAVMTVGAAPAGAAGECYYESGDGLVCHSGGGGGDPDPVGHWTPWQMTDICLVAAPVGDVLSVLVTDLILARRNYVVDGVRVDSESTCIDLDDAEPEIWEAVAAAVAGLPDPEWEASPDGDLSKGLTGLDTWLWYSGPSQVGPIDAVWTHPLTGLVFGVRGRGWTESIVWETGEDRHRVSAPAWEDAPGMGGTPDAPAATHLYNVSSAHAGHQTGYPVEVELHWVGEYQVNPISDVWTGWTRFDSTLTETFPATYEVVEVRSFLTR